MERSTINGSDGELSFCASNWMALYPENYEQHLPPAYPRGYPMMNPLSVSPALINAPGGQMTQKIVMQYRIR